MDFEYNDITVSTMSGQWMKHNQNGTLKRIVLSITGFFISTVSLAQNTSSSIWPTYLGNARRQNFAPVQWLSRPSPLWHYRLCSRPLGHITPVDSNFILETPGGNYLLMDPVHNRILRTFSLGTLTRGQIYFNGNEMVYRTYQPVTRIMEIRLEEFPGRIIRWRQLLDPKNWPLGSPFYIRPVDEKGFLVWGGQGPRSALLEIRNNGPFWHDLVGPPDRLVGEPLIVGSQIFTAVRQGKVKVFDLKTMQSRILKAPAEILDGASLHHEWGCFITSKPSLWCLKASATQPVQVPLSQPGQYILALKNSFIIWTAGGTLIQFHPSTPALRKILHQSLPQPEGRPLIVDDAIFFPVDRRIGRIGPDRETIEFSENLDEKPESLYTDGKNLIVKAVDFLYVWHDPRQQFSNPDWTYKLPCEIRSGFVVDQRRIYTSTADHRIVALDRENGRPIWQVNVGEKVDNPLQLLKDVLFVQTRNYQLLALDTKNGQTLWQTQTLAGHGFALLALDRFIIFDTPGRLVAIQWPDTSLIWESGQSAGSNVRTWPLFRPPAGQYPFLVYADNRHHLTAWDLEKKTRLWETEVTLPPGSAPVIAGKFVLARERKRLLAIERVSGKVMWIQDHIPEGVLPPTTDGERVMLCDVSNVLEIALQTGEILQNHTFSGSRIYACTLTRNGVLLAFDDGGVLYLDAKNGTIQWSLDLPHRLTYPPVAVGNHLFLMSRDGFLRVYKVKPDR